MGTRSPVPPLLFVDFWPNGFEDDTYFDVDRKTTELFHRLRVHITERYRGTRAGNWIVSHDQTTAIWDKGFQAFLNAPAELKSVLGMLPRVPARSRPRRLSRRLYRRWSSRRGA